MAIETKYSQKLAFGRLIKTLVLGILWKQIIWVKFVTYCDTHGKDGVTMVKIKYKAFVKFSMGVQVTSVISLKNSFSI